MRLVETIPAHAGFGAGTQLALAVALAASRAAGRPAPDPRTGAPARPRAALRDRRRSVRARRTRHRRGASGVGGRPGGGRGGRRAGAPAGHLPAPAARRLALRPRRPHGRRQDSPVHGRSGRFRDLPPMDAAQVGRICRLTLMQVAPAALAGDIRTFGAAITEIQEVVGEYFAPYQGGRFASRDRLRGDRARPGPRRSRRRAELLGADGVRAGARRARRARSGRCRSAARSADRLAWVDVSPARNRGASCREAP